MIITSYPRSGSSWFCRVLADALGIYLTNEDETVKKTKNLRLEKVVDCHNNSIKDPAFIVKEHIYSYQEAKDSPYNLDNMFIYMLRDPRDVMISYFLFQSYRKRSEVLLSPRNLYMEFKDLLIEGRKWRPNLFRFFSDKSFDYLFCYFLKAFLPQWRAYIESWYNSDAISVKYEDLINDTFGVVSNVISKAGCEASKSKIAAAIDKWSIDNFRERYGDHKKSYQRKLAREGRSGYWKEYLKQEHIDLFNEYAGGLIKKLDYE